jgi:type IV pilus assembly protein PilW
MLVNLSRRMKGRQRGLSVVELLVGVAIGLFLVGGATKLFVDNLTGNRRLLLEARVNQDLRAAADIIARDLRRAGYWNSSLTGVTWPAATNPYSTAASAVTLSTYSAASAVTYSYQGSGFTGFRVSPGGALQARSGGSWQDLTDSQSVRVLTDGTGFSITPDIQTISLGGNCTPPCALGSAGCPVLNVQRYVIRIRGQSVSDSSVVRQIEESVRVRNDQVPTPSCP